MAAESVDIHACHRRGTVVVVIEGANNRTTTYTMTRHQGLNLARQLVRADKEAEQFIEAELAHFERGA